MSVERTGKRSQVFERYRNGTTLWFEQMDVVALDEERLDLRTEDECCKIR